jgi:hypothetical protein
LDWDKKDKKAPLYLADQISPTLIFDKTTILMVKIRTRNAIPSSFMLPSLSPFLTPFEHADLSLANPSVAGRSALLR